MMRKILISILTLIIVMTATCILTGDEPVPAEMARYLPQAGELQDWKPVGTAQYVKGDDLFLLINGGAEIYHEYGFKEAVTWSYKNKNGKSFNLEIFRMETPEAAYGVYTFKTGDEGKVIYAGDEALLEDYYLNFRKGNFLVTITGFDSETETRAGIVLAAMWVAGKIEHSSALPLLVKLLPAEYKKSLQPNGIKYLKGSLALFNYYQFDTGDIFGLKEGVVGNYKGFKLFIFKYKDTAECGKWFHNAKVRLKKNKTFKNFALKEDGISFKDTKEKPLYMQIYESYIMVIVGKSPAESKAIVNKIGKNIDKKIGKK